MRGGRKVLAVGIGAGHRGGVARRRRTRRERDGAGFMEAGLLRRTGGLHTLQSTPVPHPRLMRQHCHVRPSGESPATRSALGGFSRPVLVLLGAVFGIVLFLAVVGEALGFFDAVSEQVPWFAWLTLILAGGFPVFRGVLQAMLQRRVTSHTLMTVGMIAAVAVGEWSTALLVVFFMRSERAARSRT